MQARCLPLALATSLGLALLCSAGEEASSDKIHRLIKQMGSQLFAEREKATKALDAIGIPALEALRKATNSDDAEIKRRAGELLKKIEHRSESAKLRAEILTPKRVHLMYKDTPLVKAVADFEKQSGYKIHLLDTKGALKKRKVTLDTGATTFWHAVELFCDKAELVEATYGDWKEWNMAQPAWRGAADAPAKVLPKPIPRKRPKPKPPLPSLLGAGGALAAVPATPAVEAPPVVVVQRKKNDMPFKLVIPGVLLLKDGKPKKLPSDDASAIRIRAAFASDVPWPGREGEVLLGLEVCPEPRLLWKDVQSIRIDKALDDRGQRLTQITPPAPNGPAMQQGGEVRILRPVAVILKKGAQAAKSLKELQGVLSLHVWSEVKPVIAAENLAKAAGKTFNGKEGGSIKILSVKTDENKKTTVQFEVVEPPTAEVMKVFGGSPMLIGKRPLFTECINSLAVQDYKGNPLPIGMGPSQVGIIRRQGGINIVSYSFVCQPGKDQGQPAKLVYLGRKRVAVEVPFRLKDVPLP